MTYIINWLLPVVVTLILGYFAAWHQDQDSASASMLNKMVMMYTLPLSLLVGTVTTPRHRLIANLPLMGLLPVGLAVPLVATLAIARYVVRRGLGESTLQALAVAFPAVPFIGLPVLGTIFGTQAANLTVAISGLVTNLLIVPASIVLLTIATAGAEASSAERSKPGIEAIILSAVQKPVVWAPVLAVVFLAAGLTLPKVVVTPLQLLGSTTSGISFRQRRHPTRAEADHLGRHRHQHGAASGGGAWDRSAGVPPGWADRHRVKRIRGGFRHAVRGDVDHPIRPVQGRTDRERFSPAL